MALTQRERFVRLFDGEVVDRAPFLDIFGIWPSSLRRWKREGLAEDATATIVREIVGFAGGRGCRLPIKAYIWPEFEREVLAEDGNRVLPATLKPGDPVNYYPADQAYWKSLWWRPGK